MPSKRGRKNKNGPKSVEVVETSTVNIEHPASVSESNLIAEHMIDSIEADPQGNIIESSDNSINESADKSIDKSADYSIIESSDKSINENARFFSSTSDESVSYAESIPDSLPSPMNNTTHEFAPHFVVESEAESTVLDTGHWLNILDTPSHNSIAHDINHTEAQIENICLHLETKDAENHLVGDASDTNADVRVLRADRHVSHNERIPIEKYFTYEELKSDADFWRNNSSIDARNREFYLCDDEFKKIFSMDRADYLGFPKWRQLLIKKNVNMW